jgi:hypothetical protein
LGGRGAKYSRIFGVISLGAFSYFIAFHSSGILDTLTLSYTLFSAGMVPAVFLSPWKEKLRLTSYGAIGSFILGGGGVVVLYTLSQFDLWSGSLLYIPLSISFISLPVLSWILPRGSEERQATLELKKRQMNRAPDGMTRTRSNS